MLRPAERKRRPLTPPPPPPAGRSDTPPATATAAAAPPAAAASAARLSEDELFAQKSLDAAEQRAAAGDVYFDLDDVDDQGRARRRCSTNATWLKRWTSTRINIEGHCDERGTAEYNLGLGERRANAVKAYLVELGVPGDRIVIVSKGKESPFCTDQERSLLAAEPPRPLHHHAQSSVAKRRFVPPLREDWAPP